MRERQMLIDKDPQADLNQLDTLNKQELVQRKQGHLGHGGQLA